MKCPEIRQHLALISLGEDRPPTSVQAEIELHLRACPDCQRWVAAENQLSAALSGAPMVAPPSGFTARTMEKIRRNPIQERRAIIEKRALRDRNWWIRPGFVAQITAAAATFFLAVTPIGQIAIGGFGELTASARRSVEIVGAVAGPGQQNAVNLASRTASPLDFALAVAVLAFAVGVFALIQRFSKRRKGNR
jgi:hypothetical protein